MAQFSKLAIDFSNVVGGTHQYELNEIIAAECHTKSEKRPEQTSLSTTLNTDIFYPERLISNKFPGYTSCYPQSFALQLFK